MLSQHWAAAWKRVDIVGLLLRHGAAVDIANQQGVRPYDLVQWDAAGAAAAAPAATDHSIYCATGHKDERRWGLPDGLRVEQNSYKLGGETESDSAGQQRAYTHSCAAGRLLTAMLTFIDSVLC